MAGEAEPFALREVRGTVSSIGSRQRASARPRPDPLGWDFEDIPTPVLQCPPVQYLSRNTQGNDLVIGDVHGQRATFERLLDKVGFSPDRGDRILLLGDVIDRGPDSPGMLSWLQRDGVYCIRGNHEQLMIEALDGNKLMEELWVGHNGGGWASELGPGALEGWRRALNSLPVALEVDVPQGKMVLVHAEVSETTPWWATRKWLEEGDRTALIRSIWSKSRVWNRSERDAGVPDVWRTFHGHVALKKFIQVGNMRWIDRGAGHASSYDEASLACVVIEPDGTERAPILVRVRDVGSRHA